MATFKPSTNLKSLQAQTTKSITFATSSKSNPTESLPSEQKWWSTKFHLGPSSLISNKKSSTSATSVTFQTPSAGSAIITHVAFAPNTIKGYPYQMAIVSGPRVSLYGGTQTSSLSRSLARPNRKGSKKNEEEEGEESFSFFGIGDDESSVKPDRTVSTGGQPAHHVAYHHDGRLLAVGCDHGYIKICDSQSRATIRTFTTHGVRGGFTIRSTGWLPEQGKSKARMIWSAGDDAILRIWDLSGDIAGVGENTKPVASISGHGDSIRSSILFTQSDKTCIVTGSYDHTIRVWDLSDLMSRSNVSDGNETEIDRCMSVMNHGAPVEALLLIQPSKNEMPIIISAGGTTIKLWNPLIGQCLSTIQTKHNKTITSLTLATIIRADQDKDDKESGKDGVKNISKRIISAGLDGLIRIYSADELFNRDNEEERSIAPEKYNLPYLHGVKTSQPITALAMSPDNTRLVVGSSTGYVTVRQRAKYVAQGVKRKIREEPKAGTYTYFMRGAAVEADADDHVVMLQKKKKLQNYDKFLQKFCYGDALDAALQSRDPRAVSR
jgi:U3 small nucleolar RNA-associated protein 15